MNRLQRISLLTRLALIAAFLLVMRLVSMQLVDGATYRQQSLDNMHHVTPLAAERGVIFDCRGRVMARNTASFTIKMIPGQFRNPQSVLKRVAEVLRLPEKQAKRLNEQLKASPNEPIIIKELLDDVALARFSELQTDDGGLFLDVKPMREYPYGEVASHVLGYVGEIDEKYLKDHKDKGYVLGEWVGQDGVEYAHERLLHGFAGSLVQAVDVNGQVVNTIEEKRGKPGCDLYLSIDARLQQRAEKALFETLEYLWARNGERSGGAVVAVEADTGLVRALASMPDYNPNWFSCGIAPKRFEKLINDPAYPLLNRAVSSAYPPGSTFKLITTTAALGEGVITPNSQFYCSGVEYVAGLPFNCFVTSGHGPINLTECLAQSCDVVYYQIGPKLTIQRMANWASQFGIGHLSGIDVPGESKGNFPVPGWKEKHVHEQWYPGDDANTAIGQGFVAATPIQMAMATAAVANDGLIFRPRLVERISAVKAGRPEDAPVINAQPVRRLKVPRAYFAAIREGMRGAVTHGTAASQSYGVDMAGKTGTAENSPTPDNPQGRNHAWFTGFTPAAEGAPHKLVITVVLEKSGGYGGALAAPIAFQVSREWQDIKDSPQPKVVEASIDREMPEAVVSRTQTDSQSGELTGPGSLKGVTPLW